MRAIGEFKYNWTDATGNTQTSTAPFDSFIQLGTFEPPAECEAADVVEINGGKPFTLTPNAQRFRVQLPLEANVGAGTLSRWRLVLDTQKSSDYDFQIVLQLADGNEVRSRKISLLMFRPKELSGDRDDLNTGHRPRC